MGAVVKWFDILRAVPLNKQCDCLTQECSIWRCFICLIGLSPYCLREMLLIFRSNIYSLGLL